MTFSTDSYLKRLLELVEPFREKRSEEIRIFAERILEAKRVFIVGNGGSLASASHFAEDLLVAGVSAQAVTDSAYLSMASNDNNFSVAFNPYIRSWCTKEDAVIGISTSGNSANVINALQDCPGIRLALVGVYGSLLAGYCNTPRGFRIEVGTVSDPGRTEVRLAEDVHSILCHMISEYIRAANGMEVKRLHESRIGR